MLSNMESDAKAELHEVERLARKARAAASDYPAGASIVMVVADLIIVGAFILFGLSTPMVVLWIAFLVAFYIVLRVRRRARARAPWATPESRRGFGKQALLDLAVNAVWLPLFFFARPVALGLLVAVLLWSLYGNIKYRHA